jgi:anaerobic ribonucleoside-triphosphate reductase
MNEKLKNKKLMNKLIEKLAIKKIIISTYHSQTNEIIEQNIAFLLTFFQK